MFSNSSVKFKLQFLGNILGQFNIKRIGGVKGLGSKAEVLIGHYKKEHFLNSFNKYSTTKIFDFKTDNFFYRFWNDAVVKFAPCGYML